LDIVKRWREDTEENNKILVLTAFSTENDYSEINIIILATTSFDINTALQEIERVGKDRKLAKYYIILTMNILP